MEAIISSMTKLERGEAHRHQPLPQTPHRRRQRPRVEDVNRLLRQFEQMQKVMKQLGGKSGSGKTPPHALWRHALLTAVFPIGGKA